MLVFTSPFILPLFTATSDPEASLPACCRRHGMHHCNMTMMMAMLAAYSGPSFTAPPCPLYPTAATPVRIVTAFFSAPPQPSVDLRRDPSLPALTSLNARTLNLTSQLTRGPPILLS